jgi:outer membrane protein
MNFNKLKVLMLACASILIPGISYAQADSAGTVLQKATLQDVINYALKNKPLVQQSLIDEEIGERDIKSALSGWLPQINGNGTLNHNLKQQTTILTTNGESSFLTGSTGGSTDPECRVDPGIQNS